MLDAFANWWWWVYAIMMFGGIAIALFIVQR